MRRAPALVAALTAASSIALLAPAAGAASATRLVGTTSCVGGGQIRLATSIDAARTAKAVATVSGAKQNRWAGQIVAGIDDTMDMSSDDAMGATGKFTAKHGVFRATATRADASSADAVGVFLSTRLRSSCTVMVLQAGEQYGVMRLDGMSGLIVGSGRLDALDASIAAERGHRYRASFAVAGKGGGQRFSAEKTATKRGVLDIVVRHVKRLSHFSKVSLTVVDLTDHKAPPATYTVAR